MQLGRTLVGAIIGGVLGIAALLAIYFATKIDQAWLAIPVAILTGLGVRWMVATRGHASYARGGITAVLALAAFVLGMMLVSEVATRTAVATAQKPRPSDTAEQPADDATEGAGEAAAPQRVEAPVERTSMSGTARPANPNRGFSTMDFLWLSIAALVAYELGRGTGAATTTTVEEQAAEEEDEAAVATDGP